jgi:glutaminyl-peptide cyclotransferase
MHRAKTLILIPLFLLAMPGFASDFSGASALEFTRKAVSFGPRPAGSAANRQLQAYLLQQLSASGCQTSEDPFIAKTPNGPVPMKNILCRFPGSSGQSVVISGHFDTKLFKAFSFVGANDGGSSSGILLELARALNGRKLKNDVWLVFFDGEEAFREWTSDDSLYGSRHLAERWKKEGMLGKIKTLINVDMIGDKDLKIVEEQYSSETWRRLIWQIAAEKGYSSHFLEDPYPIEDDHIAFLKRGVPAVDLIDFDYGPNNAWWHTAQDTMDKVSADSLQVVGSVLMELIRRLE